jgi:hypothetical protein
VWFSSGGQVCAAADPEKSPLARNAVRVKMRKAASIKVPVGATAPQTADAKDSRVSVNSGRQPFSPVN